MGSYCSCSSFCLIPREMDWWFNTVSALNRFNIDDEGKTPHISRSFDRIWIGGHVQTESGLYMYEEVAIIIT